jgi:hypothetical protein
LKSFVGRISTSGHYLKLMHSLTVHGCRFRLAAVFFVFILCCIGDASGQPTRKSKFEEYIDKQISSHRIKPPQGDRSESRSQRFCPTTSVLARRVLFEYGAIFTAHDVVLPPRCVFDNSQQVAEFQNKLSIGVVNFGGFAIELQEEAMRALLDARNEAADARLRITPLDGSVAGRRNYDDTVRIWLSRFERALNYWNRRGAIPDGDVATARSEPYARQAERVIGWESLGFWFGTDLRRSIFSSVAPPGTSQHLSLLALDVAEYENRPLVAILNKHGWFQTVIGDGPHFTYLRTTVDKLPQRGLKFVYLGSVGYWVPDDGPATPPFAKVIVSSD